MTKLNKILVAALALQLVLAVVVRSGRDGAAIRGLEPVVALDAAQVTRVQVFGDDDAKPAASGKPADPTRPAIDLVKQGAGWSLASHYGAAADAAKVADLLAKVAAMQSRGPIATGAARANQLQVGDASFSRKLVLSRAGQPDLTLLVGAPAGAGKTAVRVAGEGAIHGAAGLSAFAISLEPIGYLDPTWSEIDEARVAAIEVANGRGRIALEREGDGWKVAVDGRPVAAPKGQVLDDGLVRQLVGGVARIELRAPADPARTIAKPEATITVRVAPAAAPAAEGAAPTPAVSNADDERVFTVVSDADDRYLVRQENVERPVLVDGYKLRPLVDLDPAKLWKKPEAEPPAGAAPAGMEDLPPEVLEQLRQQGVGP